MIVKGYASTPDLDLAGHVVVPSAYALSVARRGITGPRGVKFLWQHESGKILGSISVLDVRNRGLWIEAEIDATTSVGADAAAMTKAAGGLSFSVGFRPLDADFVEDPSTGLEYLNITNVDLFEVSLVTFPCNENAVMAA